MIIRTLRCSFFLIFAFYSLTFTMRLLDKDAIAINTYCFSPKSGFLCVGSGQLEENKEFSLSFISRFSQQLTPLAPEKVVLNGQEDSINPLHGACIRYIQVLDNKVVAIKKDDPATVYFTTMSGDKSTLVFSTVINTDPIIGITVCQNPQALLVARSKAQNEITVEPLFLDIVTTAAIANKELDNLGDDVEHKKVSWRHERTDEKKESVFAESFTTKSPYLGIKNDLSAIAPVIDLYYDTFFKRFYAALQVTAGQEADCGARALVTGCVVGSRLYMHAIAPETVFQSDNHIVGARGADKHIELHKVRTMHTSTQSHYVVVVGGTHSNPKRHVYALPLVNNTEKAETHGTLANKKSVGFSQPAYSPDESVTTDSPEAVVGGFECLPGDITDINVVGDAVYVSIADADNDQVAGLFHSQALFTKDGQIKAWTQWRRAGNRAQPVNFFAYDPAYTFFWYGIKNTKQDAADGSLLKRTKWDLTDNFIQKSIPQSWFTGVGVQSIASFDRYTKAFSQVNGNRLALLALTGYKSFMLLKTGHDSTEGLFTPVKQADLIEHFLTGSLTHKSESLDALTMTGGDLDKIGFITSVEIATDYENCWFVVGGSEGLAVLARPDGTGWSYKQGLGADLKELTCDMSFKLIHSYTGIRRLSAQSNGLYVLNYNKLDRLELTASSIATNTVAPKTLYSNKKLKNGLGATCYLSDMFVQEPFIALASSTGLLTSIDSIKWKKIQLPYCAGWGQHKGPVTRLAASTSGPEIMLYALNGYVIGDQARLYRISINTKTGDSALLEDRVRQNDKKGFFASIGHYRSHIVTDGSVLLAARGAQDNDAALLEIWPPEFRAGDTYAAHAAKRIIIKEDSRTVGRILYDSTLGTWIIHGEFGVMIHE
jgi:hypothetical protein